MLLEVEENKECVYQEDLRTGSRAGPEDARRVLRCCYNWLDCYSYTYFQTERTMARKWVPRASLFVPFPNPLAPESNVLDKIQGHPRNTACSRRRSQNAVLVSFMSPSLCIVGDSRFICRCCRPIDSTPFLGMAKLPQALRD